MKYRVKLVQHVPMTATVVVEAKTEDEAADRARGDSKNADWNPMYSTDDDIEVEDIEEVL